MPVYKLNTGKWAYKVNKKNKQFFKSGFLTKKDATVAELEFLLSYERGEVKPELKVKTVNYKNIFLEYLKNNYKATTFYYYSLFFKKHIYPYFKGEELDNSDIYKFLKYVNKNKNINKDPFITLSKMYLKFLTPYGLTKNIDIDLLSLPRDNRLHESNINYYSLDEYLKFKSVIDDDLLILLFDLLFYYGLRISELRGVQFRDFDLKNNTFSIKRSLTNKTAAVGQVITTTKTTSSVRTYPLLDVIRTDFKKIKRPGKKNQDHVFVKHNLVLGESSITRYKNFFAKAANLKQIRLHDFRHSCASYLINNKMDYMQVASWLGHGSPVTTLNIYSHLFTERKEEIARFINDKKL